MILECIPPSLRFFSGNEQVDLARKMQEDPLYAIKKKEMETRSQLLKNPVKLKKIKELVSTNIVKCLIVAFIIIICYIISRSIARATNKEKGNEEKKQKEKISK